ncbi:MAG: hypothetical protein IJ038_06245 [Clostridia bacterium]|nr:hypothetical protein [Clostridia bacterium]
MKKILAFILFTALLISTVLPMSVFAETPEDYLNSDFFVGYWNFSGRADTAGTYNNMLTASNATNAYFENGRGVIKNGDYFTLTANTNSKELLNDSAVTVGFKMMLTQSDKDNIAASTIILHRANAFAVTAADDGTGNAYKLKWYNDGLTNRETVAAVTDQTFAYGTEYYFFFVVEASKDTTPPTNTVTVYWSADGKSFASETKSGLAHWSTYVGNTGDNYVQAGEVFREAAAGANVIVGNHTTVNSRIVGADISIDTMWYFNTAIPQDNLSMVALHKMNIADKTAADAPAYRGCQVSAVENGLFSTRFVATVDSIQYSEVGFEITVTNYNGDEGEMQLYSTNTVFSSIIGTDTVGGGAAVKYTAADLGGTYIYACSVNKIPVAHAATFLITPYYVAVGSTERKPGTSYEVTVFNGSVVSQAVYTAPAAE